jgi:hypothetical protein
MISRPVGRAALAPAASESVLQLPLSRYNQVSDGAKA